MTSTYTLTRLLARAIGDRSAEPEFFRALLDASVYAHVPSTDRISRRLRFIQFNHPDTDQLLLPFFSDEKKAQLAAGSAARIVTLPGRVFLESTVGATLMLNPNDEHCTLYPEEIKQLLLTGELATIETFEVLKGHEPLLGPPEQIPAWLADLLIKTLATLPFVKVAYICSLHDPKDRAKHGQLLALGVDAGGNFGERAARAVISATQTACRLQDFLLDITYFVDPVANPAWATSLELEPIYERTWGERLLSSSDIPTSLSH